MPGTKAARAADAAFAAHATVQSWIAGAQALALLHASLHNGLFDALRDAATPAALAARLGRDADAVAHECAALCALGVVELRRRAYGLSPAFRALASPEAVLSLSDAVADSRVLVRTLERLGDADRGRAYFALSAAERLATARGVAFQPSSALARALLGQADGAMPEVQAAWLRGARHAELGCGAGRDLLRILATYPRVAALGVDLDAGALAFVRREAKRLGVASRLTLRRQDARSLRGSAEFDTVAWSQIYFPVDTHARTLATARRLLKPGGHLLAFVKPDDPASARAGHDPASAPRLLFGLALRAWGMAGLSERQVCDEIIAAGFEAPRRVPGPGGRAPYLLARKPDRAAPRDGSSPRAGRPRTDAGRRGR